MKTYSLQELNEFLRRVIALNFNEAVWVTAEISQIGQSRGHFYIDLLQKEEDTIIAQMPAVIWAQEYKRIERNLRIQTSSPSLELNSIISEGMEIRLKARLEFHERFGLKLIIDDIDATYTIGKLEIQRRQVIADLQKRGLIGRNQALILPPVIQRIAVISSETAAGWQDFKNHIYDNEYGYSIDIQLFQSAMQGLLVEKMMLQQLENIKALKDNFDCVVIIRGGGSRLDLVAFDTPSVCEAVARFPLPVFTGIGHDVDQTVLDLVAHSSLKTPTAVADFILNHLIRFESTLIEIKNFLQLYVRERLNTEGGQLLQFDNFIKTHSSFYMKNQKTLLNNFQNILSKDSQTILKFEKIKIDNALKIIDLVSIEATLKRGFSLSKINNKILTKTQNAQSGDELETYLSDGVVKSIIK